jgi:hypothetical protein
LLVDASPAFESLLDDASFVFFADSLVLACLDVSALGTAFGSVEVTVESAFSVVGGGFETGVSVAEFAGAVVRPNPTRVT